MKGEGGEKLLGRLDGQVSQLCFFLVAKGSVVQKMKELNIPCIMIGGLFLIFKHDNIIFGS